MQGVLSGGLLYPFNKDGLKIHFGSGKTSEMLSSRRVTKIVSQPQHFW